MQKTTFPKNSSGTIEPIAGVNKRLNTFIKSVSPKENVTVTGVRNRLLLYHSLAF